MDIASIIGFILGIGGIIFGNFMQGSTIMQLIDPIGFTIVIVGTAGATIAGNRIDNIKKALLSVKDVILSEKVDFENTILDLLNYATKARKNGVLALESEIEASSDAFIKKALTLVVDGIDPQIVMEIMETELSNIEEFGEENVKIFEQAGGYSPTLGIIGAVLGLIHVMQHLNEPNRLGAGIAVAFTATLYGLAFANTILFPISSKLKMNLKVKVLRYELILMGIRSIQNGENPRLIEEKLKSFLSEQEKKMYEINNQEK
ncbi:MAG: flagellar motor protein [bacterium]